MKFTSYRFLNTLVLTTLTSLLGVSSPNFAYAATFAQTPKKAAGPADRVSIIGGTEVEAADPIASSTVIVVATDAIGSALCTGSLIAEDMVLTAGHCLGQAGNASIRVAFRRNIADKTGLVKRAVAAIRPNDFFQNPNDVDEDDIALIQIAGGLPAGYAPATLLADSSELRDGAEVILAGYGRSVGVAPADGADDGAGILRKVAVKVFRAQYGQTEVEVDQTAGKGACHGDSGGPAFLEKNGALFLFGVTSRGPQGAPDTCNSQAIYTNALTHTDWIAATEAKMRGGAGSFLDGLLNAFAH